MWVDGPTRKVTTQMVKTLRDNKGRYAGSIGAGKTKIPTTSPLKPKPSPTNYTHQPRTPITVPRSELRLNTGYLKDLGLEYEYDNLKPVDPEEEGSPYAFARGTGVGYHIFEGLRLQEPIDPRDPLEAIFGIVIEKDEPIPEDLQTIVSTARLEHASSYTIKAIPDYYAERAVTELKPLTEKAVTDWYYSKENAEDSDGVLAYVRSKGTNTAGLNPVEALKKQLLEEVGPQIASHIQNADSVTDITLNIERINIPTITSLSTGNPFLTSTRRSNTIRPYLGVLVREGRGYLLLDGYRNLMTDNIDNPKRRGTFLILDDKKAKPNSPW